MKLRAELTEKQFHLAYLLGIQSDIIPPSYYDRKRLQDWLNGYPFLVFYYYNKKTKELYCYDKYDLEQFKII